MRDETNGDGLRMKTTTDTHYPDELSRIGAQGKETSRYETGSFSRGPTRIKGFLPCGMKSSQAITTTYSSIIP